MPTDIAVDEQLTSIEDGRGDRLVVDGSDYYEQRAMLRAINVAAEWRGQRLRPESIEAYRADVAQALRDDAVLDVDVTVTVTAVEDDNVVLDIQLGDSERTVTV